MIKNKKYETLAKKGEGKLILIMEGKSFLGTSFYVLQKEKFISSQKQTSDQLRVVEKAQRRKKS